MGANMSVPWVWGWEPVVVEPHGNGSVELCEDFRFPETKGKVPVSRDSQDMLKRKTDVWSFIVDRKGGILTILEEGITVVVPDDALPYDDDKPTIIKLGIYRGVTSDFEAETRSIALSPTIVLEPHGLVFRKPVYLFLPTYAFPRLCRLPDTKILCRETSNFDATKWQPQDEDGDKSLLAVYPKHVVVKMTHFCQLTFVANGQERPHIYATVLVFARHNPDSANVTIGVFVVSTERQDEALTRGHSMFDRLLAQDDMAVFTDVEVEESIVIIEVLNSEMFSQQIPLFDIRNNAVRQVTIGFPELEPTLQFRLRVRQPRGLNRLMNIMTDVSRIRPSPVDTQPINGVCHRSSNLSLTSSGAPPTCEILEPSTHMEVDSISPSHSAMSDGYLVRRTECLRISPELRSHLSVAMTPDERRTLSVALTLQGEQLTPDDDILLLWEGMHDGPSLRELAIVLRVSNPASEAAALVDEWLRKNRQ